MKLKADTFITVLKTDKVKEFKIPIIEVQDREGTLLLVAPSSILKKLKDKNDNFTREGEMADEEIFYYADNFGKTDEMLNEIKDSTDIKVKFFTNHF